MPLKSSFSEACKGKGKLSIGLGSSILGCNVNILVQEDTTPNTIHMVMIDGVPYKNGEAATLTPGTYDLTWASGDGGIFGSWSTSGNIEVTDPTAEETGLEVTCGGTLTLNLVACPSGEQITNGDFETGDTTGWDELGGIVTTDNPHSGTYCAQIYPSGSRALIQTLASTPRVECITSFNFWHRRGRNSVVLVEYADGTDTGYISIPYSDPDWALFDLLPYLTAGKYVTRITFLNGSVHHLYIDDVSLIGTG